MWKEPVDIVILIMASTIGIALVIAVVDTVLTGFNKERSELTAQVAMAMIAIISLYVGNKLKSK